MLITALVAGLGLVGGGVAVAPPAQAQCREFPEVGEWSNVEGPSAYPLVSSVSVDLVCRDHKMCDTDGNCSEVGAYLEMQPHATCYYRGCYLGKQRAEAVTDDENGWYRTVYDLGFVTIHMWIKVYPGASGNLLRVWTWTDFTAADGRADFASDNWMKKDA